MTVLRLSEEIHVILNRFYIAQVIIILSDFADILACFVMRHWKFRFPPQGGKLSPIFSPCGHAVTGVMNAVLCSYSKSKSLSFKCDKSGIILWHLYLKFEPSLQLSLLQHGLKECNTFFYLNGMCAFPFTSEINFPP